MRFLRSLSKQDNALAVVKYVLSALDIKVTQTSIRNIKRHVDYPGLSSISDNFHEWGIDNMGVKLMPAQLYEIPYPAIGHINDIPDRFIVLQKLVSDEVYYFDPESGNNIKEKVNDFAKKWSGVTLLIQAKNSEEAEYRKKKKLEITNNVGKLITVILLSILTLPN